VKSVAISPDTATTASSTNGDSPAVAPGAQQQRNGNTDPTNNLHHTASMNNLSHYYRSHGVSDQAGGFNANGKIGDAMSGFYNVEKSGLHGGDSISGEHDPRDLQLQAIRKKWLLDSYLMKAKEKREQALQHDLMERRKVLESIKEEIASIEKDMDKTREDGARDMPINISAERLIQIQQAFGNRKVSQFASD